MPLTPRAQCRPLRCPPTQPILTWTETLHILCMYISYMAVGGSSRAVGSLDSARQWWRAAERGANLPVATPSRTLGTCGLQQRTLDAALYERSRSVVEVFRSIELEYCVGRILAASHLSSWTFWPRKKERGEGRLARSGEILRHTRVHPERRGIDT